MFDWFSALNPIGAAVVFFTGSLKRASLDAMLGFAAGVIFVVVEEVIRESQGGGNTDLATLGAIVGFSVMMVLDVALS